MDTYEIEFDVQPLDEDGKPKGKAEHRVRKANSEKQARAVLAELDDESESGSRTRIENVETVKVAAQRETVEL